MEWKPTITYLIEDGKTLQRLYDKDLITLPKYISSLAQVVSEIEVWEGLGRMEETLSGPRYSLSGILEDLAMRQLTQASRKGSYVL